MKKIEYNEIIFYIGQNAQENWNILDTSKKLNPDYIWFHLNSFPSCFVIMYSTLYELKPNNINDYLNYGAYLCKQNTKYRSLKLIKRYKRASIPKIYSFFSKSWQGSVFYTRTSSRIVY